MFHVEQIVKGCTMDSDDGMNNFIAGFVSGEGSFYVTIGKGSTYHDQVQCGFSVKVRADDRELIKGIWRALEFSGNIYDVPTNRYRYKRDPIRRHDAVMLLIRKLDELTSCVIPFFDRYPLRGRKRHDYEIWKQIVRMLERGEHLTFEGLEKVLAFKAEMNRYQGQDEELDL